MTMQRDPKRGPVRLLAAVAILAACFVALPAVAAADAEPGNGFLLSAEGPIGAGPVSGTAPGNDEDWYVVYVNGPSQLSVKVTATTCPGVSVLDTDGSRVSLPYTTPPGVHRFFVLAFGDSCTPANDKYTFTVEPAAAVVGGPALEGLTPTAEPNETAATAIGPLGSGTWYTGALETTNDQDWLTFFTAPGTFQVDVSATAPPAPPYCDTVDVELYEGPVRANGTPTRRIGSTSNVEVDEIKHIPRTLGGPQQYFIQVETDSSGQVGCGWAVKVDPAGAFAPGFPPPPPPPPPPPVVAPAASTPTVSAGCKRARARVASRTRLVSRYRKIVRRSRGAKRKRYVRKYVSARKQLASAKRQRNRLC